jgi:hypothetical protein
VVDQEEVVAGLYEAAAIPEQWADALTALAGFLQSKTVHFFDREPATRVSSWGALGWVPGAGIDPAADRRYTAHDAAIDPRMSVALEHAGTVWSCAEALPDTTIPRLAELYHDFLVPNGVRWTMGFSSPISRGRYMVVSALRASAEEPYSGKEKQRLAGLTRHLGLAFRLRERLTKLGANNVLADAIMEQAPHGLRCLRRHRPRALCQSGCDSRGPRRASLDGEPDRRREPRGRG